MANTQAVDVIDSFHSLIRDREIIDNGLQQQWFMDALGEFQLETGDSSFDVSRQEFDKQLSVYEINTLAYLMKIRYLERELSRVSKLRNIRTKDLTIDGAGDTKRSTAAELETEIARTKELIHKQKTHWFS